MELELTKEQNEIIEEEFCNGCTICAECCYPYSYYKICPYHESLLEFIKERFGDNNS